MGLAPRSATMKRGAEIHSNVEPSLKRDAIQSVLSRSYLAGCQLSADGRKASALLPRLARLRQSSGWGNPSRLPHPRIDASQCNR